MDHYRALFTGPDDDVEQVARDALAAYPISAASIQVVSRATNLICRVVGGDGARLALRLAQPGWRAPEDLTAEAIWLDTLSRHPEIGAPIKRAFASGISSERGKTSVVAAFAIGAFIRLFLRARSAATRSRGAARRAPASQPRELPSPAGGPLLG